MPPATVHRPLTESALALLAACAAATALLSPWPPALMASAWRQAAVELLLALALPLHWLLVATAARRSGRPARGWVALALLFPVGGAAALLLLGLRGDDAAPAAAR